MEGSEPIITHVIPEESKVVVVYRMNIPDELVTPEISVQREEGAESELWVITKKERIFDHAGIPDGYYVTYTPPEIE
jgi:hypothetical protein